MLTEVKAELPVCVYVGVSVLVCVYVCVCVCVCVCMHVCTVSSQKYAPPFCTLLLDKSGKGTFARIFSSSHAYAPSSRQLSWLSERTTVLLNVYYGKSVVLALILSQ